MRPSGTCSMAGATFLAGALRAVVAFLAAAFAGAVFFAAVLRAVVVAFFAATLVSSTISVTFSAVVF